MHGRRSIDADRDVDTEPPTQSSPLIVDQHAVRRDVDGDRHAGCLLDLTDTGAEPGEAAFAEQHRFAAVQHEDHPLEGVVAEMRAQPGQEGFLSGFGESPRRVHHRGIAEPVAIPACEVAAGGELDDDRVDRSRLRPRETERYAESTGWPPDGEVVRRGASPGHRRGGRQPGPAGLLRMTFSATLRIWFSSSTGLITWSRMFSMPPVRSKTRP